MEHLYGNNRLIHLDLKSCPLRVDFIQKLFEVFKKWGATGVLIEWEDTFPFNGKLVSIGSLSSLKSYTEEEVEAILKFGELCHLDIIPLVQTFGHLEFVLKRAQWIHLREIPRHCSSLCPSHPDSFSLVSSMVEQILKFHTNTKFLHIGGDEVWHMGACELCRQKDKSELYLGHVLKIVKYLKENYPNVRPILWDDMLRTIDINRLKESGIGDYVEPMIWEYRPEDSFAITDDLFDKYSKIFDTIWVASAYKGATGSCQILPTVSYHINNHETWLSVLSVNSRKFVTVRGIAFTGWSRYDHYAVLCELLPTAMVSLAMCLRIWIEGQYNKSVCKYVASLLGSEQEISLIDCPQAVANEDLQFPGNDISKAVEAFAVLRSTYGFVVFSDSSLTWLNPWHVKRNHTSVMHVEIILKNYKNLYEELQNAENIVRKCMTEAYFDETIDEWLGTNMHPLTDRLKQLIDDAEKQIVIATECI